MDTSLQSLDQIRASALDMAVRFGPKVIVAMRGTWSGAGWGVFCKAILALFAARNIVLALPQHELRMLGSAAE